MKKTVFRHYSFCRKNKTIDPDTFRLVRDKLGWYEGKECIELAKKIGCTVAKIAKYIEKQGCSTMELSNLLFYLTYCEYDVKDLSYSLPKDFHKEYHRMFDLYSKTIKAKREKEDAEKKAFEAKKNELIQAIQTKLHNMPELQEFFNGKNGYMVSCPTSVEDFINEGKAQHNCVGGYADKVAKEQTLVLFIRELNNPDASFITMEYCHGAIVQCMYDHNRRVEHDTEVYNFAEELATRLREKQILSA